MRFVMNVAAQRTNSLVLQSIRKSVAWLAVLPVLASSFAQAQSALNIHLWINGTSAGQWTPAIINTGSGYMVNDVSYHPAGASIFCYNMTLDFDPFISASVDVI